MKYIYFLASFFVFLFWLLGIFITPIYAAAQYVAPTLIPRPACSLSSDPFTANSGVCIAALLSVQQQNQALLDAANKAVFVANCNTDWAANAAADQRLGIQVPANDCATRSYGGQTPSATTGSSGGVSNSTAGSVTGNKSPSSATNSSFTPSAIVQQQVTNSTKNLITNYLNKLGISPSDIAGILSGISNGNSSGSTNSAGGGCSGVTSDLRLGDTSAQVTALTQVLVNEHLLSATQSTFDATVLNAVIAYQENHKAQILTPVGLTRGTGFVGSSTRAFMNTQVPCATPASGSTGGNTGTVAACVARPACFDKTYTATTGVGEGCLTVEPASGWCPVSASAGDPTLAFTVNGVSSIDVPFSILYSGRTPLNFEWRSQNSDSVTISGNATLDPRYINPQSPDDTRLCNLTSGFVIQDTFANFKWPLPLNGGKNGSFPYEGCAGYIYTFVLTATQKSTNKTASQTVTVRLLPPPYYSLAQ